MGFYNNYMPLNCSSDSISVLLVSLLLGQFFLGESDIVETNGTRGSTNDVAAPRACSRHNLGVPRVGFPKVAFLRVPPGGVGSGWQGSDIRGVAEPITTQKALHFRF